jgi:hypothetical protein
MKIFAIDPGTTESGYALWDGAKILDFGKTGNENIKLHLATMDFDIAAIEMIASYGMPVGKEVFETAVWIGRFSEICELKNKANKLVYRRDVKLHHCGTSRAKDSNIIQALKDRFGDKGTKKNPGITYGMKKDAWQAFALAVYFYDNLKVLLKESNVTIYNDLPF